MELKRYMSKKEFGEDNVGYALYVRENLKPNDYFKANTGEIYKSMNVSPIPNGKIHYANGEYSWVSESAVVNFSPNIIDLIEVGDYVNGFKVLEVFKNDIAGESLIAFENHNNILSSIYDDEIKSIVTKESFQNAEYRVETN